MRRNLMNSVTLVETPAFPGEGEDQRRYISALMSDVRRTNSAWDHSRIGAAIDTMVRTRAAAAIKETASESEKRSAG